MSDDGFFGRPRSATGVIERPQHRTDVARLRSTPQPRSARPTRSATPRSTSRTPARSTSRPTPRPAHQRVPPPAGEPAAMVRRRHRRLRLFLVLVLLVVAGVTAKLVDVQVVKPERYVAYGLRQRDGFRRLAAGRGAILDRDGQAFAMSVGQPQVVADPTQVEDRGETARRLAAWLDTDAAALREVLARSRSHYVVVAPEVSPAVADEVRRSSLPGITVENRFLRVNPSPGLAAPIVGRALSDGQVAADSDRQGISGIERQYDDALTGRPGRLYFEKDSGGNPIAGGRQRLQSARPGTDVYLTLDQSLQYETQRALADQVDATGAEGAMAVVMHPSTGEIVAMAGVERNGDGTISDTRQASAATAVFEPGSVNKVITIAGAMEDGLVRPDTVLDVADRLRLYDRTFSDHDRHPTSPWSVTDILVTSSNVGTITIAQGLGAERVDHYLRAFGFGHSTGLGIGGESAGLLRDLKDWSGVDIGAVPIGQGISVTALQMLTAYNVIANDGVYVAPKLVGATDVGRGRTATKASAHHRVVSPETAAAMEEMLCKVVTDGTGRAAAVPGYRVCGKTGTARIPQSGQDAIDGYRDAEGRYHYYSSFVGTVDGADLSIIVTVREAQTSIYASEVAAPVFSHLAASALRRYQIPPPALVSAARPLVPDVSPSAKELDGEDVALGSSPAAG